MKDITNTMRDMTITLGALYPLTEAYGSRASLYGEALTDGVITKSEYIKAKEYYGKLWSYVGD